MEGMSKLLNRPLKMFAWYALLLLACSIPVYYLAIDQIWISELDEHNYIIKHRIEQKLRESEFSDSEIENVVRLWSVIEPETELVPVLANASQNDSLYEVTRITDFDDEIETDRFRGLRSYIHVNEKTYRFTTETNVEEADETLAAIAAVTVLFFILLLLGFILLNRRISKQIWKPFYLTLDKLSTFDLNKNPNSDFETSDIEEFAQLNQELEKLILRSVSTFNQQKEFIENASHELQTPLAVLRSKLELLIQGQNLTKEQLELIAGINTSLSRLSRINKNILLLAKIDNHQFSDAEQVDVTACLEECLQLLDDHFSSKRLTVERATEAECLQTCNRSLLEMLFNNLLVNAIVHGAEQGVVKVETRPDGFSVSNSGMNQLDSKTIFNRFSTTASSANGSGLGLAISKQVCERYGWEIAYRFENGLHVFSVDF